MAAREVLTLNTSIPRIEVPQAGDTYVMPRDLAVSGFITEAIGGVVYPVASQFDIGTNPNQIPLNQYLGTMAYQDAAGVSVGTLVAALDATINGMRVGLGGGQITSNTAVGNAALAANTTGTGNTAVGSGALDVNTTAAANTAVGSNALGSNTTGGSNTAVGSSALLNTSSGANNSAFGGGALQANNTGSSNVAVGAAALLSSTTASSNVAVGVTSLEASTTSVGNVGVGRSTLRYFDTSNNTAVGFEALQGSTTVANNTGANNTALGFAALRVNTSGATNTAIGTSALTANTTGSSNTAVGNGAGSLITTGAKNSILGRFDGNQGGLDIRTASNFIVLSDGDGNPRMIGDGSGNFGVGHATFGTSAAGVLSVKNGTEPTTGPADTVQIYSVDRSAGNTIPAIYCEGSGVTNAGITNVTVTHKIAIKVNGTVYYLLATTDAT